MKTKNRGCERFMPIVPAVICTSKHLDGRIFPESGERRIGTKRINIAMIACWDNFRAGRFSSLHTSSEASCPRPHRSRDFVWTEGDLRSDGYVYGAEVRGYYYHYELRYNPAPDVLRWVEEMDRDYILQLKREGTLLEKEPNGDAEIKAAEDTPADKDGWGHLHQFHDEIFAAFAAAREEEVKQFGKELSKTERTQKRERLEKERLEKERLEKERLEKERLEKERQRKFEEKELDELPFFKRYFDREAIAAAHQRAHEKFSAEGKAGSSPVARTDGADEKAEQKEQAKRQAELERERQAAEEKAAQERAAESHRMELERQVHAVDASKKAQKEREQQISKQQAAEQRIQQQIKEALPEVMKNPVSASDWTALHQGRQEAQEKLADLEVRIKAGEGRADALFHGLEQQQQDTAKLVEESLAKEYVRAQYDFIEKDPVLFEYYSTVRIQLNCSFTAVQALHSQLRCLADARKEMAGKAKDRAKQMIKLSDLIPVVGPMLKRLAECVIGALGVVGDAIDHKLLTDGINRFVGVGGVAQDVSEMGVLAETVARLLTFGKTDELKKALVPSRWTQAKAQIEGLKAWLEADPHDTPAKRAASADVKKMLTHVMQRGVTRTPSKAEQLVNVVMLYRNIQIPGTIVNPAKPTVSMISTSGRIVTTLSAPSAGGASPVAGQDPLQALEARLRAEFAAQIAAERKAYEEQLAQKADAERVERQEQALKGKADAERVEQLEKKFGDDAGAGGSQVEVSKGVYTRGGQAGSSEVLHARTQEQLDTLTARVVLLQTEIGYQPPSNPPVDEAARSELFRSESPHIM